MKKILMAALLMTSLFAIAAEEKKDQPVPTTPPATQPKMTTRDAKKNCKEEGKTGADLIQCMKDKKEEK